jgi:hypothetical protein
MEVKEMNDISLLEGPHLHKTISSIEVRRGDLEPNELL